MAKNVQNVVSSRCVLFSRVEKIKDVCFFHPAIDTSALFHHSYTEELSRAEMVEQERLLPFAALICF